MVLLSHCSRPLLSFGLIAAFFHLVSVVLLLSPACLFASASTLVFSPLASHISTISTYLACSLLSALSQWLCTETTTCNTPILQISCLPTAPPISLLLACLISRQPLISSTTACVIKAVLSQSSAILPLPLGFAPYPLCQSHLVQNICFSQQLPFLDFSSAILLESHYFQQIRLQTRKIKSIHTNPIALSTARSSSISTAHRTDHTDGTPSLYLSKAFVCQSSPPLHIRFSVSVYGF